MNKKIIFAVIIASAIFLILFGIGKKSNILPNSYYQVYLDGKLIGTIKSKEKLEKYINNRGILIKNQVIEYQKKIELIDSVEKIFNSDYYSDEINYQKEQFNFYRNILEVLNNNIEDDGTIKDIDLLESLKSDEIKLTIDGDKLSNYEEIKTIINNNIKQLLNGISSSLISYPLSEVDKYHLNEYIDSELYNLDYSYVIYMRKYIDEYKIYSYVDNVYKPLGIKIEKINTYSKKIMSEDEIYERIVELKPCTIEGYQFRIKRENLRNINYESLFGSLSNVPIDQIRAYNSDDLIIYTTDKEIFDKSIEIFVEVFVNKEDYEKYKTKTQDEILDTGKRIEKIYLDHEITVKKTNISVKERIFTNQEDLSSYLLYGDDINITTAIASSTDTISSFAYKNHISVEEFFLFNREFTSINNMFYNGQVINIVKLNPQINLVVEEYTVEDKEINYDTIERYNSELSLGSRVIVQNGQNGINRVGQNVKKINGSITSIEPVSRETIVGSTNEIVEIGTKYIPYVGSLGSWGWPTEQGYTITSYFGYRPQIFGEGNRHSGIDIAGVPYGSNVYASNNGTIIRKGFSNDLGYHIMINHNNGYYTLYAHLSGFPADISLNSVVARGQVIGYIGQSGWATGPHLHYQMNTCPEYWDWGCILDPLLFY